MRAIRLIPAALLAAVLTVAVSGLSRVPVRLAGEDDAELRLAWRTAGAAVEDCRQPTAEELAELPVHMRNPRACIGQIAPYLLSVSIDGRVLMADTLHAAGARGDRPLSVLRDLHMAVGVHEVQVDFRALLPEGAVVAEGSVTRMSWSGTVALEPRDVALVTTDGTGRALELRHSRQ